MGEIGLSIFIKIPLKNTTSIKGNSAPADDKKYYDSSSNLILVQFTSSGNYN